MIFRDVEFIETSLSSLYELLCGSWMIACDGIEVYGIGTDDMETANEVYAVAGLEIW